MFDLDDAVERLARDQSKARRHRTGAVLSHKAKREAEQRRQQQDAFREKQRKRQMTLDFQKAYIRRCEKDLRLRVLTPEASTFLTATSIYGHGDKISLPPSFLENLTSSDGGDFDSKGNPLLFRLGILNPDYRFPSSPLVAAMEPPDDGMDVDGTATDAEETKAYLAEMRSKYVSVAYCTVLEFTQEEGHIGLPYSVSCALLASSAQKERKAAVAATRTVDPSMPSTVEEEPKDISEEKTPGHLAWGAFDVPDVPIEVSLVELPKGRACTLTPTEQAVKDGFYNLKDMKYVLEQSIGQTRATLAVNGNDMIHAWYRGERYDLLCSRVDPPTFGAVSCINTDITVDIGTNPVSNDDDANVGQTISPRPLEAPQHSKFLESLLLSEPPTHVTSGVCEVQVRYEALKGTRRFLVDVATVKDLFLFAACVTQRSPDTLRLVSRYPRRILQDPSSSATLLGLGIGQGKELFLVESRSSERMPGKQ